LRTISPQAARRAILQVLKTNSGNVTETARLFNVSRPTIYKAISKQKSGNLDDDSTAPKSVHNKTPEILESLVVDIKAATNYGPLRIKEELFDKYQIDLSGYTIRNIVRRNKKKAKVKRHKPHKKGERYFVDWYSAKPFEVVQIDLKYVVDQKALSLDQIDHVHTHKLPLYQWSALDVNSRFKLIAYSDNKTWTNGLT